MPNPTNPAPSSPDFRWADALKVLPRWARVAFAARCARRVQPLFIESWRLAPREHVEAVDSAIALAEASARMGSDVASGIIAPSRAVSAADAAEIASSDMERTVSRISNDAPSRISPAAFAADSAYAAHSAAHEEHLSIIGAMEAVHAAIESYRAHLHFAIHLYKSLASDVDSPTLEFVIVQAMRRDFERLLALGNSEGWTDDSPVDPDLCGPLWPSGRPEGFPPELQSPDDIGGLEITLTIPDGMSDEDAEAYAEKYILALDRYHRAIGGSGLRVIRPVEIRSSTPVGVTP